MYTYICISMKFLWVHMWCVRVSERQGDGSPERDHLWREGGREETCVCVFVSVNASIYLCIHLMSVYTRM